ncbi:MAG: bifunctional diaminohydroxyphosphoribosylaminopyrimidine deaminase/5-amino-6-(5-phosphoribosylamino)uracil reductase RibD [Candidatus Aminicenantes bacterium]|nr:bifunctional diaminohydroxyphosphoribosylaminopyrimidine deaminase/5-amino-6-(5-phosphoribosylamino)uracil reductase RibD [Candidatus Aminicenantes bacterium]RLE02937.1 MAG: bifunctional diaminohydroxyphosphoribosylaminopyrimidine deaminase/5-amino-6-(5-phosphoribosylamino)uracil reductase RibD [Candidatus Aminicenantes bacterium]
MNSEDLSYLHLAYALAEKARGLTWPNPLVGAVVVKNGTIIARGYHLGPGYPHAEIVAIETAVEPLAGACLYLTLEPCVHWGKTPPCVETLVKIPWQRIVISAFDPNPIVYQKGVAYLQEHGYQVEIGLLEEKNKKLNEAYYKFMTAGIPFVCLKTAASLDGKIATRTFSSQWISSPLSRDYSQLLRGEYQAIMVGIGTILRDDPLLTVRHPQWPHKTITRVIVDSQLKFPPEAKMLSTLDQGEIIIFTTTKAPEKYRLYLEKKGVRIVTFKPTKKGLVPLEKVLEWLGQYHIANLLVEGGGNLIASFLEKKLADKIILFLAPKLIGGLNAPSLFPGQGVADLQEALFLRDISTFHLENDIIIEGYF